MKLIRRATALAFNIQMELELSFSQGLYFVDLYKYDVNSEGKIVKILDSFHGNSKSLTKATEAYCNLYDEFIRW